MGRYIVRRLLQAIPVLILNSILVFLLIHLIPGDPAQVIMGPDVFPEQIEAKRREMGLDKPLPVQYVLWAGRVLRGDLGISYLNNYPVGELILIKVRPTLELTLAGFAFAVIFAFPLGILAAIRQGGRIDRLVSVFAALAYSIPTFWVGILMVIIFAVRLRWLPPSGYVPFTEDPVEAMRLLLMPAITIGLVVSAVLLRFLRASLLEVLNQDYIRTARAKGLQETMIVYRHALKNALIPVVTVMGLQLGAFMGGAVVTEAIFGIPGLGQMILYAILSRDYTVVQGSLLLFVSAFVFINLITDISYAFFDPRIRYE